MKNLIKNFFALIECLYENKFSRYSILATIAGILLTTVGFYIIGIILIVLGLFVLYLVDFGIHTYVAYKKELAQMIFYDLPLTSDVYCILIGYKVAERRFKKLYPEKYNVVMKRKGWVTGAPKIELAFRLRVNN